jgi:hypothetical protein
MAQKDRFLTCIRALGPQSNLLLAVRKTATPSATATPTTTITITAATAAGGGAALAAKCGSSGEHGVDVAVCRCDGLLVEGRIDFETSAGRPGREERALPTEMLSAWDRQEGTQEGEGRYTTAFTRGRRKGQAGTVHKSISHT